MQADQRNSDILRPPILHSGPRAWLTGPHSDGDFSPIVFYVGFGNRRVPGQSFDTEQELHTSNPGQLRLGVERHSWFEEARLLLQYRWEVVCKDFTLAKYAYSV